MGVDDKPPEEQNADEINNIEEKKGDKKDESNKKTEAGGAGSISEETETKYEESELTIDQEDRENKKTDEEGNGLKGTDLEESYELIKGLENGEKTNEEKNNSQETDGVIYEKLELVKHLEDVNEVKNSNGTDEKKNYTSDEQNMKDKNVAEMGEVENDLQELNIENINAETGEDNNSQATEKTNGEELQETVNQNSPVAGPSHDRQVPAHQLDDSSSSDEGDAVHLLGGVFVVPRVNPNIEMNMSFTAQILINNLNRDIPGLEDAPSEPISSQSSSDDSQEASNRSLETEENNSDSEECKRPKIDHFASGRPVQRRIHYFPEVGIPDVDEGTFIRMTRYIVRFFSYIDQYVTISVFRIITRFMPPDLEQMINSNTYWRLVEFAERLIAQRRG